MPTDAPGRILAPFKGRIHAFTTTRGGGFSRAPFNTLNFGDRCGDEQASVDRNRDRLSADLPEEPRWLAQVHGVRVIRLEDWQPGVEADAAWTGREGQVAAILTADCLPVVLADRGGACVGIAHAGWRGLAAGVLEQLVSALPVPPGQLQAWIGPRIGRRAYEVDATVRDAFDGFEEQFEKTTPGHWLADLPAIAVCRLQQAGVGQVIDSGLCTFDDSERFFSYRRDSQCGRIATVAWLG